MKTSVNFVLHEHDTTLAMAATHDGEQLTKRSLCSVHEQFFVVFTSLLLTLHCTNGEACILRTRIIHT